MCLGQSYIQSGSLLLERDGFIPCSDPSSTEAFFVCITGSQLIKKEKVA